MLSMPAWPEGYFHGSIMDRAPGRLWALIDGPFRMKRVTAVGYRLGWTGKILICFMRTAPRRGARRSALHGGALRPFYGLPRRGRPRHRRRSTGLGEIAGARGGPHRGDSDAGIV